MLLGGLAIYTYGTVGYMLFGHTFLESVYRTGLTLTTVGFTADGPQPIVEKMFTTSVALVGVVLYLFVLAVIASILSEGRYVIAARRRRMLKRISELRNHMIVCAYGRVGRSVVEELRAGGIPLVVIDPGEAAIKRMEEDDVLHIGADPTSPGVLDQAGITRARALITAVDSDASNVFITMAARSIRPDLFIVARAGEAGGEEHLYRAGAERVISPFVSSGRQMALLAQRPGVSDYLDIAGLGESNMRLEEIRIERGSPFQGRTVEEAAGRSLPLLLRQPNCELIASPAPDATLEVGAVLVMVSEGPGN